MHRIIDKHWYVLTRDMISKFTHFVPFAKIIQPVKNHLKYPELR